MSTVIGIVLAYALSLTLGVSAKAAEKKQALSATAEKSRQFG